MPPVWIKKKQERSKNRNNSACLCVSLKKQCVIDSNKTEGEPYRQTS